MSGQRLAYGVLTLEPAAPAPTRPAVLRVVLRSGAEVEADVTLATDEHGARSPLVTESAQTQRLTDLTWLDREGAERRLLYVDPDEIAAVVLITEPDGPPGGAPAAPDHEDEGA